MIVGKQAVKNDLEALDKKIDSKFEEAKDINLDAAAQITNAMISSGSMLQDRPIGVYHFDSGVSYSADFGITVENPSMNNGCGLYMKTSDNADFGILNFISWFGDAYVGTMRGGVPLAVYKYLTTKNTIVDANGFIKAA